jgi:hypothetical protein
MVWTTEWLEFDSRWEREIFFVLPSAQIGSGAHQSSYWSGTGGSFLSYNYAIIGRDGVRYNS